MGIRTRNLGNLFKDTRSRMIIIITAFLILIALLIGWWKLRPAPGPVGGVTVGQVPQIESIPGSLNPTEQYAKLVQEQNVSQAVQAKQTGGSAIPTIVRTELFTPGQPPLETTQPTGVPFDILARQLREGGVAKPLWFDDLKNSNCAKDLLQKAQQQGATVVQLRAAGCTAKQLLAVGFGLPALKQAGYSTADLKDAGFTAMQLRGAGFDAADLRKGNFSACDAKNAGFSPADLKRAGYSDGELLGAGFSPSDIQAAGGGLPTGVPGTTEQMVRAAGCNTDALTRLREQGISAAFIRQTSGCSAQALKNAGYTARDLVAAGYSPQELRAAGFTAAELKAAGLSARDLRAAGFTAAELARAGFTPTDLKNAGFSNAEIAQAGFTPAELSAAGIIGPGVAPALTPQQAELQRIMNQQAAQMDQQQFQQRLQTRQSTIAQQVSALINEWSAAPSQVFVAGTEKTEVGGRGAGKAGQAGVEGAEGAAAVGAHAIVKAGDILYAVMDTAVNSDEPGPVLATITQGKLKGAKLIGSLRLPPNGEAVILSFNLMSAPSAPNTFAINAVAVDPDTARTALSSETDSHYLSRYGALFAASFLEGWGRGQEQSATSVTITPTSSQFVTDNRSNGELAQIALGRVGQAWGRLAMKNADRPPTVYVYSGTGVGILFLQDIQTVPGLLADHCGNGFGVAPCAKITY